MKEGGQTAANDAGSFKGTSLFRAVKSRSRISLSMYSARSTKRFLTTKSCQYRGVHKTKEGNYQAQIRSKSEGKIYLGTYKTEEEAALSYDIKIREMLGERAETNFIERKYLEMVKFWDENGGLKSIGHSVRESKPVKFRGVESIHGSYRAYMKINGVKTHLGVFYSQEEAAKAYDAKALLLYGKKAKLNFPSEEIVE
jgi:hypothetical protein